MVNEDAMLATVGAIYDAGLDPALWPAALERAAEMLDMVSAAIGLFDGHSRVAYRAHARIDEQAVIEYADRYRFIDGVMDAVSRRPAGLAFSDNMVLQKTEIRRSRFYDEWCRPYGLDHAIQGFAFREYERSAFVVFGRARRQEAFSPAEVDVVTRLLREVARACRVQIHLQAAQVTNESTAAALDRMPQAVMLLDAQARVLHANQAATTLLQEGGVLDAGPLGLRARHPEQTKMLRRLVARASGSGLDQAGGTMLLSQPDGEGKLVAHVVPYRGVEVTWISVTRPTAVVIVAASRRRDAARVEHALQALFGLTPAEAKVAHLIAGGAGVEAVAVALRVAPATVRTHLVRVYQKTVTGRQAELAQLVGQIANAVGSDPEP